MPRSRKQTDIPFPNTWGGARKGAGRPPSGARAGVPHLTRPVHKRRFPLLVTMKVKRGVRTLRQRAARKAVERAMLAGRERFGFRLVEYSIHNDHLHLMVEASDRRALSRGMQGLSIRIAKGVNRAFGRKGKLLADRYHARALKTPLEVKRALLYTLNNAKKHRSKKRRSKKHCANKDHARWQPGFVDPYSSAPHFDGWSRRIRVGGDGAGDDVTAAPRTWLLRLGWKRHGRLDPDAAPPRGPT